MLSNPTTTLPPRQRAMHRRQNSTPSAFDTVKMSAHLPRGGVTKPMSAAHAHRRGLSLDTRRQQYQPIMAATPTTPSTTTSASTRQGAHNNVHNTVSTTTNPGLQTTQSQHHVLREAQQQRIPRPGHGQPMATMTDENFLISPQGTPHSARFVDAGCFGQMDGQQQAAPFDPFAGPMNTIIKKNHAAAYANGAMAVSTDFELFGHDSALSTPTFMTFPESPAGGQGWLSEGETASTRRSSRRISNGIMDRVAKFETLGLESPRPVTPPNQNATNYFPPTPMETPHDNFVRQAGRSSRFAEDYDESMEETIKPNRNNRSNRSSTVFDEMRRQAEVAMSSTPPQMHQASGAMMNEFLNLNSYGTEFIKAEPSSGFEDYAPQLSARSLPTTPGIGNNSGLFENHPELAAPNNDSQATVKPNDRSSPHRHRRTESVASIASAASIASLNIEETKTDTGVTMDDIATYITGPDPTDGKWVCQYEACGKRFGRRENIKSHVQTHLNDRQYQCPHCHKCFVRQHDLKRHAKIHTGVKPYPCECGNTFARHDALTRHRQRGMCIGAFDGIVRKVVKRGRPRKNRPDMDVRVDKSARTRKKNRTTGSSPSSASSQSGYSDSSAPNSPTNDFDGMLSDNALDDMDVMDVAMADIAPAPASIAPSTLSPASSATMQGPIAAVSPASVSSAPMPMLTIAPDMSDVLAAVSPVASELSHYSHISPASLTHDDFALDNATLPVLPAHSPAKSTASHPSPHNPGTPPELSASSSPPPSSARFLELSGSVDVEEGDGLSAPLTAGCEVGNVSVGSLDEEFMKAFTNAEVGGLVSLDGSGLGMGMGMLGKYEDEYGMFADPDDVFFGTS